jgi:hypothetical protein
MEIYPVIRDQKYSYINAEGRLLADFKFSFGSAPSDGVVEVGVESGSEFRDSELRRLFTCKPAWEYGPFCSGKCVFVDTREGAHGVVDKEGNVLLPPRFGNMLGFQGDVTVFSTDGWHNWGVLHVSGRALHPATFNQCMCFAERDGWAAYRLGELWGLVDAKGARATPPEFQHAYSSSDRKAVVFPTGSRPTIIDVDNGARMEFDFEDMRPFQEGLAPFKKHGKWGCVDTLGHIRIEPRFEYLAGFSSGYAVVGAGGEYHSPDDYRGGLYGAIDASGVEVLPQLFPYLARFHGKLARYSFEKGKDILSFGYVAPGNRIVWNESS